MANSILRLPSVIRLTGLSRSTIYLRISEGYFPRPISLGARAVGWPEDEILEVNRARIAGKSNPEISELVSRLEDARRGNN